MKKNYVRSYFYACSCIGTTFSFYSKTLLQYRYWFICMLTHVVVLEYMAEHGLYKDICPQLVGVSACSAYMHKLLCHNVEFLPRPRCKHMIVFVYFFRLPNRASCYVNTQAHI